MNPFQPALIRAAIERLALEATVRIATDNDEDGASFAAIIRDWWRRRGGETWRLSGLRPVMPRTGTMRFWLRAG